MGEQRPTTAQRELLSEMAAGAELSAGGAGSYPSIEGARRLERVRALTVDACVRLGWIARGERNGGVDLLPRYRFDITEAGRRTLQGDHHDR